MIVHLVDGTYELFRYFLSPAAAFDRSAPEELRAVRGVVGSILGMLEGGATHIGVATDHVIESFRNALWPQYKTGEGMDPLLYGQFQPLEDALSALGVVEALRPGDAVIEHLVRTIDWYRRVISLDQSGADSQEIIFR